MVYKIKNLGVYVNNDGLIDTGNHTLDRKLANNNRGSVKNIALKTMTYALLSFFTLNYQGCAFNDEGNADRGDVDKAVRTMFYTISPMIITSSPPFTLNPQGCTSNDRCNVDKAYDLASEISKEDPNKFVKEKGNNSVVYYDKSLKVVNAGFWGIWPIEGEGIFINIDKDRDLSVTEWDVNQLAELHSGKIEPSEINVRSFGYMNDKKLGEVITLSDNNVVVSYVKSRGKWEKNCCYASEIRGEINSRPRPILCKKSVKEEEVLPFLKLVKNIRERYPIK